MSRTCPRCEIGCATRVTQGIEIDICPECMGIFLDASEFDRLIAERFEGKRVESMFAITAQPSDEPLNCPACAGPMDVLEHDQVELDRCPECAGIWLDGNERHAFAEKAAAPPPREIVRCAGCNVHIEKRFCIWRMDAWYCEDCVVEGNHPGPEAALVGMHDQAGAAMRAFAQAKGSQAIRKADQRQLRERANAMGRTHYGRPVRLGVFGAWLEQIVSKLTGR